MILWPALRESRAMRTTTAEVRSVTLFQLPRSTSHRTMVTLQEFDRVHAAFVPEGASDTAFALDFVDHGSVRELREGAAVQIQYSVDNVRAARLVEGTRSHYWKNAVVPVTAVLGLALLTSRKTHGRRSRTRPKSSGSAAGP